jgi:hypothetical protein
VVTAGDSAGTEGDSVATARDTPGIGRDSVVAGRGAVCMQAARRMVPARSRKRRSRDPFIDEIVPVTGE